MSAVKNLGDKHHYIPKFYLKQWTDSQSINGELFEFSNPYNGVIARRKVPDATGYVRGLYSFDNLNEHQRDFMEKVFLQDADDTASRALQKLLINNFDLEKRLRDGWSRFIMTLLHRNPERINEIRKRIREDSPNFIKEIEIEYNLKLGNTAVDEDLSTLLLLNRLMDSEFIGTALNKMRWGVLTLDRARHTLLTSDRPIMMTNGLSTPDAHLALPISPNKIFVAANDDTTIRKIKTLANGARFVAAINDLIVRQAVRYVYGTDEKHLNFISKRFGERLASTPLREEFR